MKKLSLFLLFLLIPSLCFAAAISTLTDNFDDNSIDAAKWVTTTGTGMTVAETNQQLEVTTALAGAESYLTSKVTYDLTGSQATIKVIDAGNQALASYQFYPLEFEKVETGYFFWRIQAGNIIARSAGATIATATYVAATYRYLKIREAGGNLYWDYSADGISWTNFVSQANPFAITSLVVWVNDVYSTLELSTTTAKVDDFNILSEGLLYIDEDDL